MTTLLSAGFHKLISYIYCNDSLFFLNPGLFDLFLFRICLVLISFTSSFLAISSLSNSSRSSASLLADSLFYEMNK